MRAIDVYMRLACIGLQRLLQSRDDFTIEASVAGFGSFFQCHMNGIRNVFDRDCGGHRVHQNETIMVVFWCFSVCLSSAVSITVSEKTDLLRRGFGRAACFSVKNFHPLKLRVRDEDDSHFPINSLLYIERSVYCPRGALTLAKYSPRLRQLLDSIRLVNTVIAVRTLPSSSFLGYQAGAIASVDAEHET